MGEPERQIEHVLLLFLRLIELIIPLRIDNHVAGGTGERALASTLQVDIVTMGDLQHREPDRRLHLPACLAVRRNERHLRHNRYPLTPRGCRPAPWPAPAAFSMNLTSRPLSAARIPRSIRRSAN